MKSKIREFIDMPMPRYATMFGKEILEWLLKNTDLGSHDGSYTYDEIAMDWIGQWYSICQYYLDIPSSKVVDIFPFSFLEKRYNILHDLDIAISVEKVLNAHKLPFCKFDR